MAEFGERRHHRAVILCNSFVSTQSVIFGPSKLIFDKAVTYRKKLNGSSWKGVLDVNLRHPLIYQALRMLGTNNAQRHQVDASGT